MKKYLILTFILNVNCFSQQSETFNYDYGISLEYNKLQSKTKIQDIYANYFTSNYKNGITSSILFKNRIWIKKWYLSIDGGAGFMCQKQNIIFSNSLDPIIEFDVSYKKSLWQFNAGFGKIFNIPNGANLNIELGTTIIDFFKKSEIIPHKKGTFTVGYVNTDDFWNATIKNRAYFYSIILNSTPTLSQWIKVGVLKEFNKKKIELGINYTFNRLVYQNFITIKSINYTAIGNSRSKSNAFGIYFNFFM